MRAILLFSSLIIIFSGCSKSKESKPCAPDFGVYDGCPLQRPIGNPDIKVTCEDCTFGINQNSSISWFPTKGSRQEAAILKDGFYKILYKSNNSSKGIKIELSLKDKKTYLFNDDKVVTSDGEKSLSVSRDYFIYQ